MNPFTRAALFIVGLVYLLFNVVIRLFAIVCALFAIYIMLGLMIEWTKMAFSKHTNSVGRKSS